MKEKKLSEFQHKPLAKSTIVVTGGSRDIGGGIVLELAKVGAQVCAIFRSHADRAQKIVDEVKQTGKEPLLLQADLTTDEGRAQVFSTWQEKFNNDIDILVLCASGATMEINVDANVALIDKFIEIRKEQIQKGEKLSLGSIIFLQSEPGHYQRVIDGVFDFLAYYREKVGPAKRAGEDAFRKRLASMKEVGVRGIVVCPPEVQDTFNMKLFELQNPQAREKSRELSAMLGTMPFVTIAQVAKKVRELLEDKAVPNGHHQLFGNAVDGLTLLSAIYGDEAMYVHTCEKTGHAKGVGHMIVNPSLWKRDEEPSFTGKRVKKDQQTLTTSLAITKEHLKGHFRPDIAAVFPGHKSIRTAALALSSFLNDNNAKVYLSSYEYVKFRSPVVPGQTLTTEVTLTASNAESVTGNAVQSVNGTETMIIHGMTLKKMQDAKEESVLLLDQLIEASAQTVGLLVLEQMPDQQLLPLFHGTGKAVLHQSVQAGDTLLIKTGEVKVITVKTMNIFTADLQIYRGFVAAQTENGVPVPKIAREELVAEINNLQGLLLPKDEVLAKIDGAA